MTAGNNYEELLEKVCDKLDNLDNVKEIDILDIKNSVEAIENLVTDTQSKSNFQDIKDKLEHLAMQVDSCNDALLKDLYNDLNALKTNSESVNNHLENLQNIQNLALTSAEFEEFQKQQLDLALKTNENIFNELKTLREKSQNAPNPENIQNLENQIGTIHNNLNSYVDTIISKVELIPGVQEISSVVSDLNSVQLRSIKQTNALIKDIEAKLIQLQTNFDDKELKQQVSKISEIYDNLNSINAWIEKVGYLNQSIENVYSRLGENIDFDDVSEKVDIIYENITALNHWTMKIDKFDESMSDVQEKLVSLKDFMGDARNINNIIDSVKEHFEGTNNDKIDFEDLSNKMDVVYENLTAINQWAEKVDYVETKIQDFDKKFDEDAILSKIDVIYENISLLNEWVEKIDGFARRSEELDNKFTETNDSLNSKVDEITQTLAKTLNIVEDVPDLKDKLDDLSGALHAITSSTKNDTDSYIYTLLDIESDFLKLQKFLDDKTNITSQDINALKERFSELSDDISSISVRTNKLILSADDANKEFKEQLEIFKTTLQQLDIERQQFNPEAKFVMLADRVNQITNLIQDTTATAKNLNNAFIFLADWVDASGNMLNKMQSDISDFKNDKSDSIELKIISNDVSALIKRTEQLESSFEKYRKTDLPVLNEAVSYIITKIDEMSEKDGISADIASLHNEFSPLHDEISNIGSQIETARENIDSFKDLAKDNAENINNNINSAKEEIETVKTAMTVLAEGMDAVQIEVSSVKDDINNIHETVASFISEAANLKKDLDNIQNTVEDFKNEDISELKSSLTGVMVQMNTALTPDIDSLNERIESLVEQNQKEISKIEEVVDNKLAKQEQRVIALEGRIEILISKFDKLIDVMSEDNKNDEIKDLLNYIVTQLNSSNESITSNQQNNGKTLDEVAKTLSSFDKNINKIVNYIEED